MAIINNSVMNGGYVNVTTPQKSADVSTFPVEVGAGYRFSAVNTALTGLGSFAVVAGLKNLGSDLMVITRVTYQAIVTTSFAAGQTMDISLFGVRGWTGNPGGGTAISQATPNNQKTRTGTGSGTYTTIFATAGAAALGTSTFDTHSMGMAGTYVTNAGDRLPPTVLYRATATSYPIVCAKDEGICLLSVTPFGITGVVKGSFQIEWVVLNDTY